MNILASHSSRSTQGQNHIDQLEDKLQARIDLRSQKEMSDKRIEENVIK